MGYSAGYEHDVFLSYAHIDDIAVGSSGRGWVSTLVDHIQTVVRTDLGSADVGIWKDYLVKGNEPLDDQLFRTIERSATLLVIMSEGYLKSDWCAKERERFVRAVSSLRDRRSRVFVAYIADVKRSSTPEIMHDLPGYQFWHRPPERKAPERFGFPSPRDDDRLYWGKVVDLAGDLASALKGIRAPDPMAGDRVFVAEVTDDLEARRDELRRALTQEGFVVVPTSFYPRDSEDAFQAAMRADLAGCRLFVQLLGPFPGRRPTWSAQGFPACQHELAQAEGVRVLQWRSRDTDPEQVEDKTHRDLLQLPTVQASGLEEFKQAAIDDLRRPTAAAPPALGSLPLVFVNSDGDDWAEAQKVLKFVYDRGMAGFLPKQTGSPDEILQDLEANLAACDGLVVLYGRASDTWVRGQLRQALKVRGQHQKEPPRWVVLQAPPAVPPKSDLNMELPSLAFIDCRNGIDPEPLNSFLNSLRRPNARP